ncbi:MAG: GNAT family N-acetyltransferase [Myxococcota bacterium]
MAVLDDEFWAGFLGVAATDWTKRGVFYRAHVGLKGYRGFWCFHRNDCVVVSAPAGWVGRLRELFFEWDQQRLMDAAALSQQLGAECDRTIGPAFQGCLVPRRFVPTRSTRVRKLESVDATAVERFKFECGSDWEDSGLEEATSYSHAYFDEDQITAMAAYRPWRDDAGDPCIITHPAFRRKGRGVAVASAVVSEALATGKLLLYQTLASNEGSVRIAFSLGYECYAHHVAVRLKHETPQR